MLGLLKKLFGVKPVETLVEAPYKVETPVVEASVEIAKATAEVTAENKAKAVAKAKVKRAPAKTTPIKKAAVSKTPRKPKTS
jgi:hypothetical protein